MLATTSVPRYVSITFRKNDARCVLVKNKKRESRRASLIAVAICIAFSSSAFAQDYGDCVAPDIPPVPGKITDSGIADRLSAGAAQYAEAAASFGKCLTEFARENEARLTRKERSDLRKYYDDHIKNFERYVDAWNRTHSEFLKEEAKKNKRSVG